MKGDALGYRTIRELEYGGMAWPNMSQQDERVAKNNFPDIRRITRQHVERIMHEARILQNLQQSNNVRFQDVGESEG